MGAIRDSGDASGIGGSIDGRTMVVSDRSRNS